MQVKLVHEDKNLSCEISKSFEDGIVLDKSYKYIGVASAVVQGTDFASLYDQKPMYRKHTSYAPQIVIIKATTHSHMRTHDY